MKILVTGASGLLGRKVSELALERGHEVYSVYNKHEVEFGIPVKLDLTDRDGILKVLFRSKPDVVIHAAAYTNVDACETCLLYTSDAADGRG